MIAWDGDKEAYDLIVGYWGEEVAKRLNDYKLKFNALWKRH